MSLKAKTLVQIIRENCVELYNLRCRDCIGQCEFEDSDSFAGKWIEVDDVEELEQKVKNLETDRDNLLKSLHTCTQNLNSYAKESVELKQKLQPIFEHYKDRFINHVWMGYEIGSVLNDFLLDWMDKILEFEELLKEENRNHE
jgi:tetrahydromethanopterin S-methyltransferase subunit B